MNTILLSFFSGINIAFAILSFFIWRKNKTQILYFYFGIFSLFSGLYFLLIALSSIFQIELFKGIIFCAAIYYGIFPWLIFELIDNRKRLSSIILSMIFALAFLIMVFNHEMSNNFAIWQIVAHIGLIGLFSIVIYASFIFYKKNIKGTNEFLVLVILFVFLGSEEIIANYTSYQFLSNYIPWIAPLDIYPILFTLILGARLSIDFYSKNKLKIKLMESELKEKQLQLMVLEKKRLQEDIQYKTMDLTNFGIEITKNREFLQSTYNKLENLKSSKKDDSLDFREVLKSLKSRLIINKDLNYFNGNVEKINHAFISKLKKTYPSLTSNEIHLASLLRLNLNTKEIAIIKNISPNSVKVLRYRLRKKLDMNKSNNLSEFLNNIN
jgi:DNA-binding CsgD family transcriptional regulator